VSFRKYEQTVVPRLEKAMQAVIQISLNFPDGMHVEMASPALASFLELATGTRTLRLYLHSSHPDYCHPVELEPLNIFDQNTYSTHLAHVSLKFMALEFIR
jgi:hypothetical protein